MEWRGQIGAPTESKMALRFLPPNDLGCTWQPESGRTRSKDDRFSMHPKPGTKPRIREDLLYAPNYRKVQKRQNNLDPKKANQCYLGTVLGKGL